MGPDKNELLIVPNSEITLEVTNPETLERSIEAIRNCTITERATRRTEKCIYNKNSTSRTVGCYL